jgi:hypothetical protein
MGTPRSGHYVSLVAEGPGPTLWYSESIGWTVEPVYRTISLGVPPKDLTPILGLPAGYHTRIVFESVRVLPQPIQTSNCCCIPI